MYPFVQHATAQAKLHVSKDRNRCALTPEEPSLDALEGVGSEVLGSNTCVLKGELSSGYTRVYR